MNSSKYKWILYAIVLVIVATISMQLYWNYKNYLTNKQQLINDVQQSTDNAIEAYFTNLAAQNTIAYAIESDSPEELLSNNNKVDSILKVLRSNAHNILDLDSLNGEFNEDISIFKKGKDTDSIVGIIHNSHDNSTWKTRQISVESSGNLNVDSIFNFKEFRNLTTRVLISLTNDSLELKTVDTLLKHELSQKQIDLKYGLALKLPFRDSKKLYPENINSSSLSVTSTSNYLPRESQLKVYFNNITKTVLKRSLSGILLSTLLILAVVSCLFYLLKIINDQKQLAEVKNDLISNITHEFKTPIATIGVALESIKDFNVIEDKEKTKKYLNMSNDQLSKLNLMVEKLLETATLDSESLELNKEEINLVELLQSLTEKHRITLDEKSLGFSSEKESIIKSVDIFHFENAINNIIDNAIKYGGNVINVSVKEHKGLVTISVSDNGNTLSSSNKDKIFEKFYRIPKGNTHDVKGFGIGLYYSKTIIEKHNGVINLDLGNKSTTFNIVLPNE